MGVRDDGDGKRRGCVGLSGTRVVGFHSTPFVFLTDTFTGKVLCFFKLGWGQAFQILNVYIFSFLASVKNLRLIFSKVLKTED